MNETTLRIPDFQGVARDASPAALPPTQFQKDEGGDLFDRGTWRLRRGRTRVNILPFSGSIETILSFQTRVGSRACVIIDSGGVFRGYSQVPSGDTVTIGAGVASANFTASIRVNACEFRGSAYMTNGWERMRRWDGNWARRTDWSGSDELEEVPYAGIAAPPDQATYSSAESATAAADGPCTQGAHLMRIRWKDSRTGYVSDPNEAITFTVSGASKKVTFDIGNAANEIDEPTDPKVDTLIIEWTVVGGTEFFVAVEHLLYSVATGTLNDPATVDISDEVLAAQLELPYEEDGHGLPPAKSIAYPFRGRMFLAGDTTYSVGTASATLSDATITGSGTDWDEYALGNTGDEPLAGARLFKGTDTQHYEIDDYVSATSMELKAVWNGASASGFAYQILSKNNRIYYSMLDLPESFPPLNYIDLPTGTAGGRITAVAGFDDSLLFFTDRGCWRHTWLDEPNEGQSFQVPGGRGAISHRVVVVHDGRVYAMDSLGVWVYQGGVPVDVSRPIYKILKDSLDISQASEWHGCYHPRTKSIRWYVNENGQTKPKFYLQFDPVTGKWTTGYEDVGITESSLGKLADSDDLTPLQGDENGSVWRGDAGTVNGGSTYHHLTATGGTTTTPTVASLASDGSLRGVPVYRVADGTVRVISSHNATSFTVSSAFSGSITVGEAFWLGRVMGKLKTKAFRAMRPKRSQNPRFARFWYKPTSSSRHLAVRVYYDHSATAFSSWSSLGRSATRDNLAFPGTTTGYATSDWVVDLSDTSGLAEIPLGMESCQVLELEIEVIEPDTAVEIWGLEIDGVEGEQP